MDNLVQVQWTATHLDEARDITEFLLDRSLVGCVSIFPLVESWYIWEGEVECSQEVKVLMKTAEKNFPEIDKHIRRMHTNDVPEILMFKIAGGSDAYLKWLTDTTAPSKT